jgi:hypothetical protein
MPFWSRYGIAVSIRHVVGLHEPPKKTMGREAAAASAVVSVLVPTPPHSEAATHADNASSAAERAEQGVQGRRARATSHPPSSGRKMVSKALGTPADERIHC